jgi:thioredoxin 1
LGIPSFRSPIIQDWVSGCFFVQAISIDSCVSFPEWIKEEQRKSQAFNNIIGDFMKSVLIDFSATWCGPCRMQKPILEELEKKYKDKVEFKVVDVDENQQLASKYGIHAVPTLIILKDEVEVKRFMGVTQGSVLASELEKIL